MYRDYNIDIYVRDVVASDSEDAPFHMVIRHADAEKAIGQARRLAFIGGRLLFTCNGFVSDECVQRSYLVQFERTLLIRFQAREVVGDGVSS